MSQQENFSGSVLMYGHPVNIDTTDGTGFAEVLDHMSGFLNRFKRWSYDISDGNDMQQEANLAVLEGILLFCPERGVQLSTFLHRYVHNRMIDFQRKKHISSVSLDSVDTFISKSLSPEDRVELIRAIDGWDTKWRRIMFRLFVKQDRIRDVAKDEGISPWGLTRAVRRKMKKA